jgi:hypothetical protein
VAEQLEVLFSKQQLERFCLASLVTRHVEGGPEELMRLLLPVQKYRY